MLTADATIRDGCGETAIDYARRLGLQYCHWLLGSLSHCLQTLQPSSTLFGCVPGESRVSEFLQPRPPNIAPRRPQSPRFPSHVGRRNWSKSDFGHDLPSSQPAVICLPVSSQNGVSMLDMTMPRPNSPVPGDGIVVTAAHSSGSDRSQEDDCSHTLENLRMAYDQQSSVPENLVLLSNRRRMNTVLSSEGTVSKHGAQDVLNCRVRNTVFQPWEGNGRNLHVIRKGMGEAALESSLHHVERAVNLANFHSQQVHAHGLSCGQGNDIRPPSKVCQMIAVREGRTE